MPNFFVYMLVNPFSNLPFYVGKGSITKKHDRIKDHLSLRDKLNKHKYNTILKIRKQKKEPVVEIVANELEEEFAFNLEKELILSYGRRDIGTGILTNLTEGGEGTAGVVYTEEYRKQLSQLRKGKYTGEKNPFYGKKHTQTTKDKISMCNTGRNVGSKSPCYGKPRPESLREKLRQANLGKHNGALNQNAKYYLFTSPTDEKYIVHGYYKEFVTEKMLAKRTLRSHFNKGTIPPPGFYDKKPTPARLNTTGWKVDIIAHEQLASISSYIDYKPEN